jgi:hypothetical protein
MNEKGTEKGSGEQQREQTNLELVKVPCVDEQRGGRGCGGIGGRGGEGLLHFLQLLVPLFGRQVVAYSKKKANKERTMQNQ